MWGGGGGGGGYGGKGSSMSPPQGFVNELRKGWMPPPLDFANFTLLLKLYAAVRLLAEFFNVSTVPKIRHFKRNSSIFSTRNYKIDTFLHVHGYI